MKAHIIRKNHIIEEYKVFHKGNEFNIKRYVNVKGIPDNKSYFVYKKIGYQTYESLRGNSKFISIKEAKQGIKNTNYA
tara:strand:+ start:351 stop:584 length:234 start_codon:yes stop_codon:yes gene_type:complete